MKSALIDATVVVTAFATPALSPVVVEGPGYCAWSINDRIYINEKYQNPGSGNRYSEWRLLS
jgi:hypothetical protein